MSRPLQPRRAGAGQVLRSMLLDPCDIGQVARILERAGQWEAALCLAHPGLLKSAEKLVESTRVLTAACPEYPAGWSSFSSPPPALWLEGSLPKASAVGIVGSREPPPECAQFARDLAAEAVKLGHAVVSGGAPGCDREAGLGAREELIEIIPCGVDQRWGVRSGCRLSARDPQEAFTTAAAMERNALVYAYGLGTVVCHARFKAGGAWIGATEALRRRLGLVLVWEDRNSLASRALVALGAVALANASALERSLERGPGQQSLFASPAC